MERQLKETTRFVFVLALVVVGCGVGATPVPATAPPTVTSVPPSPAAVPQTPVQPTASSAPVSMTVTFTGGKCTLSGPKKVHVGTTLAIDWTIVDKDYDFPGLCVITVDAGKTIADLDAAPGYPQPSWVHLYYCWENPGSGKTVNAELKTGPVYFVCFSSHTTKIGVLGPIEVGQ